MAGQTIVRFELEGFKELYWELQQLSRHMQRKGADYMTMAGAAVVRDIAKPNVYRSMGTEGYISYIPEEKGEYAGMTIGGRNKAGMVRTKFDAGHVARNLFIGKSKRKSDRGRSFWRIFLAPQAWFGIFIEYGGKNLPARPFLRPAIRNNVPKILDTMRTALNHFLRTLPLKRMKYKGIGGI